jgi:hypothetical protein
MSSTSRNQIQESTIREETDPRARAAELWINRLDPLFLFLDRVAFAPFFRPTRLGDRYAPTVVELAETDFLLANLNKHRAILWANVAAVGAMKLGGLLSLEQSSLTMLLPGFTGPVVVTGVAWYTISFIGVPEKFLANAMLVTGILFLAQSLSLTVLFTVLGVILPTIVTVLVIAPIYIAMYGAAVFYDNLDGLKAAASQAVSPTSRAVRRYALSHGGPPEEREDESNYAINGAGSSHDSGILPQSRLMNHFCGMLAQNLGALEDHQPPAIANHLIVHSLDLLFRLLGQTQVPIEVDEAFDQLISHGQEMDVDAVNEQTVHYLRIAAERFQALIGPTIVDEMADISSRLAAIDRLRAASSRDLSSSEDRAALRSRQELADFLFIQVFRQLTSIARSHWGVLLEKPA